MKSTRIIGTTHHGTYKKVIDVLFTQEELSMRSNRKIARDGVEIELDLYEDLQEGDIIAENESYAYAVKIYIPKPPKENTDPEIKVKNYL